MIWGKGKYFLLPWLVCLLAGLISILLFGKEDFHLLLNAKQPQFAESFFKIATLLGEGIAIGLAIFYMLFRSRYGALFLATSWLTTFAVIQFLKLVVFDDALRPAAFFKDNTVIRFIEGVTYHNNHSFPSGHTGEVFSVFFALTLLSNKPRVGIILFLPAFIVAYSRVFLSQHFMEDILAGSFIAITCVIINYWTWWRNSYNFRNYIDRH